MDTNKRFVEAIATLGIIVEAEHSGSVIYELDKMRRNGTANLRNTVYVSGCVYLTNLAVRIDREMCKYGSGFLTFRCENTKDLSILEIQAEAFAKMREINREEIHKLYLAL